MDFRLGPRPVVKEDTVDEIAIVQGAQAVDSWRGVTKWWTGPWIAYPQTRFYRPLSSTFYWLEYRAFGSQGYAGFMLVHWLSHVLVCVLAVVLLSRLISRAMALLTVGIWAACAANWLTLPSPLMAYRSWIDSVEMWFSAAALAYLLVAHIYLKSGRRWWFGVSLMLFVLAVAFKEMAYVLPLLFLLLAWYERKLGGWKEWWPLAVLLVVGLAWRSFALEGVGQTFGSNDAWWFRWLQFILGGRVVTVIAQWDLVPAGVASFLAAAVFFALGKRRQAALIALVGVALLIITDFLWADAFGESWLRLVVPSSTLIEDTVLTLIFGGFSVYFLIQRQREQILGYGWSFVSYLPLLLTVTTSHTNYFPSLGWALWLAVPLATLLCWLKTSGQKKLATSSGP